MSSEYNKNRLLRSNILKKLAIQTFKSGTIGYVADQLPTLIDKYESEKENLDTLGKKFRDYNGKDKDGIFTLFELLSSTKELHADIEKILKDSVTITEA